MAFGNEAHRGWEVNKRTQNKTPRDGKTQGLPIHSYKSVSTVGVIRCWQSHNSSTATVGKGRPLAVPGAWILCLPQAALTESSRLKEQLSMLQLKTDLLGSIFGQESAATLLEQVTSSVRDRDLLHNSLLQRKSKLQVSISSFVPGA